VQDVLRAGAGAQPVQPSDRQPQWPVNQRGAPLWALPTPLAFEGSRAFRGRRQGCVWDVALGVFREPVPEEWGRALGYAAGSTAAPGVTQQQRHQVTGRCMDANVLGVLGAVCMLLSQAAAYEGPMGAPSPWVRAVGPQLFAPSPPLTEQELQRVYGRGYQLLAAAGWQVGQPLGRTPQRALLTPSPGVSSSSSGEGLGYGPLAAGRGPVAAGRAAQSAQWVLAAAAAAPQVVVQPGRAAPGIDLGLFLGS
jgi:hypothetical protein